MKKYLLIFFCFLPILAIGQNIKVQGTISSSKNNEPLIGVTVQVKGTMIGASTDIDGHYNIQADKNATLVFSMIGLVPQEITLNGREIINVIMSEDISALDEVVVVGYGTVKKSDLTSSISTVKGKDLNTTVSGNAISALQGKANGVQVTSSGSPGSTPRVIIRGLTTVNGSDPLYVVDGVPVGTNANFLSQNDIESIEVLKDASASAIYGTRGSNGVILITTKKGKIGATKFHFNSSVGFQTLDKPDLAGAEEYEKVFKARYTNDGSEPIWSGASNLTNADGTDWWDESINTVALIQNYSLGFEGGSEKQVYSGSINYFRQDSQYKVGFWEKATMRYNSEFTFNDYVKVGIDFNPRYEHWKNTPSLMHSILTMDPTTPVYKDASEWSDNPYNNYARSYNNQTWNPVASLSRMSDDTKSYALMMNPYVMISPFKGFTFKSQFGLNAAFQMTDGFNPEFFIDNLEQNALSKVYRNVSHQVNWNWNNIATYMTTIDDNHNINIMGGFTMEEFNNNWLNGSREDTPSYIEALRQVSAGTLNEKASGSLSSTSLASYLFRAMYNYKSRYYLTASVRVDGSSKFTSDNQYATFGALSGSWRITEEEWMKNQSIFDNLKIRAGWGRVGNQNIDNSSYLTLISESDYVFGQSATRTVGSSVSSVGNTNLQWETVEDYNLGLDMTILDNRLEITADLFRKESKDMLLKKDNLLILGYPSWNGQIWENIGKLRAQGWELSAYMHDQINDFSYNVGFNLSSVKNTAVKLLGDSPIYSEESNGDYIIKNEEGGELSRFYGYEADGLFQNQTEINSHTSEHGDLLQPNAQPGDVRFKDLNNDGVLDENDKHFLGSAFPDFSLGINAKMSYKNWDLTANFYGTFGNDIYNNIQYYSGINGTNVYAGAFNKTWSTENTDAKWPRLSVNDANLNYKRVSSLFVEDGSYLKCKLLQFGYTIPDSVFKNVNVRLSVSAQNLFTITNYSGEDPETAALGGATNSGIDNFAYPNPRTFLFGINVNF
ncbi:MAG: TonB-dependent receptor [Bacteroidales bacterium]